MDFWKGCVGLKMLRSTGLDVLHCRVSRECDVYLIITVRLMGVSFADYVRIRNDLRGEIYDILKEAGETPAGLQLAAVMSDRHTL